MPLGSSASEKKFKAVMLDIGIMQQLCGLTTNNDFFTSDLLDIYKGSLAEQFVGQELISAGNDPLYYWSRDAKSSTAEVDYLFARNETICPVEVKSGSAGKLGAMIAEYLQELPIRLYFLRSSLTGKSKTRS